MSEPKDFLTRWSHQKLDAPRRQDSAAGENAQAEAPSSGGELPPATAGHGSEPAAEFDPATLPPIESIDATTDIAPFLRAGVPAALRRAALRRAWSADPAIRDFVGLAENSWDFNAPDGAPGFGPLTADDVRKLANHFAANAAPPDESGAVRHDSNNSAPSADAIAKPQTAASDSPQNVELDAEERRQEAKSGNDRDNDPDISSGPGATPHVAVRQIDRPIKRHGRALPKET
jgi:hypothetical protein